MCVLVVTVFWVWDWTETGNNGLKTETQAKWIKELNFNLLVSTLNLSDINVSMFRHRMNKHKAVTLDTRVWTGGAKEWKKEFCETCIKKLACVSMLFIGQNGLWVKSDYKK